MTTADKFYEQIDGFAEFSQFTQLKWYRPLPSTWFVLITDVKGSTAAIEEGLYKEVNSLGPRIDHCLIKCRCTDKSTSWIRIINAPL